MAIQKFSYITVMESGAESFLSPVNSIKYASPIHCHDFYEFFLITKGKVVHVVNNEKQQISEGTLVFMRPSDIHYYEYEEGQECEFINVCFTKRVVNSSLRFLGEAYSNDYILESKLPPCINLSPIEKDHLVYRLENVSILSKGDLSKRKILLRGILVEVLLNYFSQLNNSQKSDLPLWMESLLLQMQKKENFTQGLDAMYRLSQRSPGHLNRVFKQFLNMTPTEYINGLRLKYAKHLLLTTKISVIDISLAAGFDNLSHFYHLFKKQMNVTPVQLRKNKVTIHHSIS